MMMPSDNIDMNSLVFLPESVMHASRAQLPGTNILMKSQLGQAHLQLFRVLNKSTEINTHWIDNMNQSVAYQDNYENPSTEDESKIRFLSNIMHYMIEEDVIDNSEDVYGKYLNNILPDTKLLIQMMQSHMKMDNYR